MKENEKVRMDQWLTAVRVCKTRSQAAELCKKSKVTVNGTDVKPSYTVKLGEIVEVKEGPIIRTFIVKGLHQKRVSARAAEALVEETTPPQEFDKLRLVRSNPFAHRERGTGRPTKKERREIERLKNGKESR